MAALEEGLIASAIPKIPSISPSIAIQAVVLAAVSHCLP